jgi:DNA-directed RNA polymerase specialized sigma subunit
MTAKEYLSQAYRLDQRINSNLEEVARLREMASSISSPNWGERVETSRSPDPPFVRCIMRMMELEEIINRETDMLVTLKKQIRTVIEAVPNMDEQMVLRYRYIHNCTWEQIGDEMNADPRTVRRWHGEALKHVKVPENFAKS